VEMGKYPVGSRVSVKPSAAIDVCGVAWPYLEGKVGTVNRVHVSPIEAPTPGTWSVMYSVEFDEEFRGGWDCFGYCVSGKGQQISEQHLDLESYGKGWSG